MIFSTEPMNSKTESNNSNITFYAFLKGMKAIISLFSSFVMFLFELSDIVISFMKYHSDQEIYNRMSYRNRIAISLLSTAKKKTFFAFFVHRFHSVESKK